jgi:hypothetical protein
MTTTPGGMMDKGHTVGASVNDAAAYPTGMVAGGEQ